MLLGGSNLGWLRKSLLSEAPADDKTDDYQLDDTDTNSPDDEGDNPAPDKGGDDSKGDTSSDGGDDYQMDDSDPNPDDSNGDTGDDSGDGSGDDGTDTGDDSADDGSADDSGDEADEDTDNENNLKKLVLLAQFKELSTLSNNLLVSVENLDKNNDYHNDENMEYLQNKLDDLKSKLSFTLTHKFLTSDYKELLKLFYYFKFNLNDLANFAENLIKERNK